MDKNHVLRKNAGRKGLIENSCTTHPNVLEWNKKNRMVFLKGVSPIPGNPGVPISGFRVQLREVVRVKALVQLGFFSGQCLAIDGEDAEAKWVGFCVVLLSVHFNDV